MADKVSKDKKRKRNTDGTSKASKKVAIEADKTVDFTILDVGKWAPVIASTPGLALPNKIQLQPYTKARRGASQRAGRSRAIAATELLLQSSTHPKIDYVAREEESGVPDALLKHYVGVYDPDTGKLEVVEARKMVVRGSVRDHQARIEDNMPMGIRDQRNNLGEAFGTKKSRKAIASATENAIGPARTGNDQKAKPLESGAAAVIASMAAATELMPSRLQLQEEADAAKPRPKANLKATDVKEVYTADSLIGKEIFKHVPTLDWVKDVEANKEVIVTSRFVANRIRSLSGTIEKLKILRYLYILLEFLNSTKAAKGGRQLPRRDEVKTVMAGIPEVLVESVKRRFSDAGFIKKYNVDLIITHCCALACLVDNYEVDMWDLRQDLKLEQREMQQYFMEIGAKIVALPEATRKSLGLDRAVAAQRKVAKLKIPLEFPKMSFAKRR